MMIRALAIGSYFVWEMAVCNRWKGGEGGGFGVLVVDNCYILLWLILMLFYRDDYPYRVI